MNVARPETDIEYKALRAKFPDGYVANMRRTWRTDKSYYVVHKVSCPGITPGSSSANGPGAFTEKDYRKVVGITLEGLVSWGQSHGFAPTSMKICERCMKGVQLPARGAPGFAAARYARPFDPKRAPKEGFESGAQRASPEETRALQEKATKNHHALLVALDKVLKGAGWGDIEEMSFAIDLWARAPKGGPRIIFEAKTLGDEVQQTRAALAQLLEYRHVHGNPEDGLCLVVNRRLGEARERFLAAMGITVLWQQGATFHAAGDTSADWVSSLS